MPNVSRDTATETIALEGHTLIHYAGAELVEFSPTDVLGQTIPVVLGNLRS
jgi:hypothetical protein